MARVQLSKTDDPADASSMGAYAPKKYSAREQVVMGLRIFAIGGVLFGLLWLLGALKAQ